MGARTRVLTFEPTVKMIIPVKMAKSMSVLLTGGWGSTSGKKTVKMIKK